MTPAEIQLIVSTGAVGVLIVGMALLLRGDLQTKGSVAAAREADAKLTAEITRDRDDWKAMAKDAIEDVGKLGEALETRNRIDEELRRRGVIGTRKVGT